MPDDSNGIYSVPAGTIVSTGDTILPSQHNPWANDSASAISNRFSKDGRAPATGNWNINSFRLTNVGAPVAGGDATNKTYVDGIAGSAVLYTPQTLTAAQQAAARTNVSAALRGHLFGLTLSNNSTDPTNDIDIAAGEAASTETNPVLMTLASGLTKRLDGSWAVGSGNGGLDTGSIANTTYHVWLIQRSDTGVVDVLFSASATSPTMPANYDRKRRIGSIIRVSGAIRRFVQHGDFFQIDPVLSVNETNPGTSAVTQTLDVPAGIVVTAKVSIVLLQNANAGSTAVLYSALANEDLTPAINGAFSVVAQNDAGSAFSASAPVDIITNTSRQVRSRLSVSNISTIHRMNVIGWRDTRGRDA